MTIPRLLREKLARIPGRRFPGSRSYWEQLYKQGGNSGCGSYGAFADFKADFLNSFVTNYGVTSVVELGSGGGHQLSLARYPEYLGIDILPTAVQICKARFASGPTKRFATKLSPAILKKGADLAISLDVIYHLVEDPVFERYMSDLFALARRFVFIYSSNLTSKEFAERFPLVSDPHVKHRQFTAWVEKNQTEWELIETAVNPYRYDPESAHETSFADFFVFRRLMREPSH